jgi:hypothetical protein
MVLTPHTKILSILYKPPKMQELIYQKKKDLISKVKLKLKKKEIKRN